MRPTFSFKVQLPVAGLITRALGLGPKYTDEKKDF